METWITAFVQVVIVVLALLTLHRQNEHRLTALETKVDAILDDLHGNGYQKKELASTEREFLQEQIDDLKSVQKGCTYCAEAVRRRKGRREG